MSDQSLERLRGARARLRAAEAHLGRVTDQVVQLRRQALAGTPDVAALAAAIEAYQRADAAAEWARIEYERLSGSPMPPLFAAECALLVALALDAPVPLPAIPTSPVANEEPEAIERYVPQEPERRRWAFAHWLLAQGKLTEFPAAPPAAPAPPAR